MKCMGVAPYVLWLVFWQKSTMLVFVCIYIYIYFWQFGVCVYIKKFKEINLKWS